MRVAVAVAVACLSIGGISAASEAQAAFKQQTNIPAQRLGPALRALARDRNLQLVYATDEVESLRTSGAVGELTADQALAKLLSGTGLTFRYLDDKTITVQPLNPTLATLLSSDGSNVAPGRDAAQQGDGKEGVESKNTLPDRFRVAQTGRGLNQGSSGIASSASSSANLGANNNQDSSSIKIEEVLVTAQKRSERLQDVPVPVTALGADTLVENNLPRLQDYYASVPGFSVSPSPGAGGQQMLTIRGITTGAYTNPTVGVTVDDVPYGSSTSYTGNVVPDIDPGDLARVEVLRGPQGALYGASSMGGLVKFVTVDPSTERVSGGVQAGVSGIHNGAAAGYDFRGSINVPLSDDLAVRASGFTRERPGYIDNPVLHINGINQERVSGGRLSALWRLSDTFSLKLSALYQNDKGSGADEVSVLPGLEGLQQNILPGIGGYERTTQVYSAILTGKVGSVDVTSVTGYNVNKFSNTLDYTFALGGLTRSLFGVAGTPILTFGTTDKFSQEIRASIPIGERVEWLVGGFYTNERRPSEQDVFAEDPATGATVLQTWAARTPGAYNESAAFTDLTFHLTDRVDVQIGGRDSKIRQAVGPVIRVGPLFGDSTAPKGYSDANPLTYLVTPRFKVSTDLMVYARFASGYRPGGGNGANPNLNAPRQFDPDKTENYEVGLKGDFMDHTLSVDASLYYIDWKSIQVSAVDPVSHYNYTTNGSEAKSDGVELSVEARPLTGLTIAAWGTYSDVVLTKPMPSISTTHGVEGDRLPFSPRFSGNLSLNQEFSLTSSVRAFAGGTISYVGNRLGTFVSSPQRQYYPAYAKTDLRAGVKYDSWTASAYVTNVADNRGLLGGGIGTIPYAFTYIQPRTIGLNISWKF